MSEHDEVLDALTKVLRTRFTVWETPEIIAGSSLKFRPDAFFVSPHGELFIVEVKAQEISMDHIRVLLDFCSDLQQVLGQPLLDIILASSKAVNPEVNAYAQLASSVEPFKFHLLHIPAEKAARLISMDTDSPEFKQESARLLDNIRGE